MLPLTHDLEQDLRLCDDGSAPNSCSCGQEETGGACEGEAGEAAGDQAGAVGIQPPSTCHQPVCQGAKERLKCSITTGHPAVWWTPPATSSQHAFFRAIKSSPCPGWLSGSSTSAVSLPDATSNDATSEHITSNDATSYADACTSYATAPSDATSVTQSISIPAELHCTTPAAPLVSLSTTAAAVCSSRVPAPSTSASQSPVLEVSHPYKSGGKACFDLIVISAAGSDLTAGAAKKAEAEQTDDSWQQRPFKASHLASPHHQAQGWQWQKQDDNGCASTSHSCTQSKYLGPHCLQHPAACPGAPASS